MDNDIIELSQVWYKTWTEFMSKYPLPTKAENKGEISKWMMYLQKNNVFSVFLGCMDHLLEQRYPNESAKDFITRKNVTYVFGKLYKKAQMRKELNKNNE